MFEKTRITLTAWYVLILMIVSISFSVFLFMNISRELDRALRMQIFRIEHPDAQVHILVQGSGLPYAITADPDVIQESKQRLLASLILINGILLIFSSLGGYFLAGRTLKPIQDALEEQRRFVADASHELKTPLTSLRTGIEVSLRGKDLSVEQTKELLQSNLEDVIALQVLTDNLLTLAQNKKENTVLSQTSLNETINQAIKTVMPLAKTKKINIVSTVNSICVQAISEKLTQVWVILLDNAIKYSPAKSTITINTKKVDGMVNITITDEGIGIAKEELKHVFDRFYRVSKSRSKNETPGYGLGLSIAKKIIELSDGTISLLSEVGKGTSAVVVLHKA